MVGVKTGLSSHQKTIQYENRVIKRIFGPTSNKIKMGWRKCNFITSSNTSPNMISVNTDEERVKPDM
jgi:hypothetical protein